MIGDLFGQFSGGGTSEREQLYSWCGLVTQKTIHKGHESCAFPGARPRQDTSITIDGMGQDRALLDSRFVRHANHSIG